MEEVIEIPSGAEIDLENRKVLVKGPKGSLERDFGDPRFNHIVFLEKKDNKIFIKTKDEKRKTKSMAGTIHAHISNMIKGVSKGYKYTMKIVYTHFPITVSVSGNEVQIKNFLGEKGSRSARIAGDARVRAEKDIVEVSGIDIESVSQTAANIEMACRLRGRDRRIFQDGIYISEKAVQLE